MTDDPFVRILNQATEKLDGRAAAILQEHLTPELLEQLVEEAAVDVMERHVEEIADELRRRLIEQVREHQPR